MQRYKIGLLFSLALGAGGVTGAAWAAETRGLAVATFYDRERLETAVLLNERVALDNAVAQLAAAAAAHDRATSALEALHLRLAAMPVDDPARAERLTETERLQKVLDGPLSQTLVMAEDDLAAAQQALALEQTQVAALMPELRDGQVFAFNRALNTPMASKLVVQMNAAELQAAINGQYDSGQISLLTKALVEEAKFLSRAEAYDARALETNDSRFLDIANRLRSRAADQKSKYLARIKPGADTPSAVVNISTGGAVQEQRALAREAVLESRAAARAKAAEEARRNAADDSGVVGINTAAP